MDRSISSLCPYKPYIVDNHDDRGDRFRRPDVTAHHALNRLRTSATLPCDCAGNCLTITFISARHMLGLTPRTLAMLLSAGQVESTLPSRMFKGVSSTGVVVRHRLTTARSQAVDHHHGVGSADRSSDNTTQIAIATPPCDPRCNISFLSLVKISFTQYSTSRKLDLLCRSLADRRCDRISGGRYGLGRHDGRRHFGWWRQWTRGAGGPDDEVGGRDWHDDQERRTFGAAWLWSKHRSCRR